MCRNTDHDSDAVSNRVLHIICLCRLTQNSALVRCQLRVCVCIAVFESILRVKSGDSFIWWVPLIILSLFHNKIYKTEYAESSIILNEIRSLLGGSSEHGFREHRPCYIHGRTHVGISDVAKCGKGILTHQSNKIILFTVTLWTRTGEEWTLLRGGMNVAQGRN